MLLQLPVEGKALATSGGYGTWFDRGHRHHHLFDPASGRSTFHHAGVSVVAARATVADALSTALAVLPAYAARQPLAAFGPATAYFMEPDGQQIMLEA